MDRLPFSVYLGWVLIATIINASIILYYNNWGLWGLSEMTWTSIILVAGAFIAIFFSLKNEDLIFPLVFIWAYAGIAVEQADVPLVKNTALLTAIKLSAFIIFRVFTRKR